MCQSRIRFKRKLRECRQNEEIIRANEHAKSFMDKDMTSFWKGIKKSFNSRVPLVPMIDKCIVQKDICDMWQAHYKNLLNSVETYNSKEFVKQKLKSNTDYSIAFSLVDILTLLKTLRLEKHVE